MCEKCGTRGMEMTITAMKPDGSSCDVLLRVAGDMDNPGCFGIEAHAEKMPLVVTFFTAAAAAVFDTNVLVMKSTELLLTNLNLDA